MASTCPVQVVVVGSCMRDLTSFTPRLPLPGETVLGQQFVASYGGKGANQCLAAARLGATTAMVAKVGRDVHGDSYLEKFKSHNVNVDHVTATDATHTGIASIFVDSHGQNCIVIVNGANEHLSPDDINRAEDLIAKSSVIVCQLESNIQATLLALKLARKHQVKTIFNAAPANQDVSPEFFTVCDVLCVNELEAEMLVGHKVRTVEEAGRATRGLLEKGCKVAIVTLGENGAVFADDVQIYSHIRCQPVKAVDTTGAGDAFVGALAYFLAAHSQMPLSTAVQRACDIATISVQSPGTHVSYPWRRELSPRMFDSETSALR